MDSLYFDTTTGTYFTREIGLIHDTIRDIFYEVYLLDSKVTYVELIRELQRRLDIPEITDEKLCELYSFWDGRFLDVKFQDQWLSKGTCVTTITYA